MITYKTVSSVVEMAEIVALQQQNLTENLTQEVQLKDGFVTAEYNVAFLAEMNEFTPSVIAVKEEKVVGYCLAMSVEMLRKVPVLADFYSTLLSLSINEKSLSQIPFIIMGQVCVANGHRGQGIFREMYNFYKSFYQAQFDFVITDVNTKNTRSIQAHQAIGFQTLLNYTDNLGENWNIVAWQLR